jgi:hypothetical protein
LLNVEFDTIWQRHKRQLIGKIIAWSISLLFVVSLLIGVYTMNQPIDVKIQLKETTYHNPALPPIQPTELVLDLKDEVKKSILLAFDSAVVFKNIPHKYLNKEVYISANIRDFIPLDTALVLSENMQINIQRNTHVYGDIKFQLWDKNAKALSGVKIQIQGYEVVSDEEGYVSLFIPLEKQLTKYHIATSVPLSKDTITLPCGEDDVLIIK